MVLCAQLSASGSREEVGAGWEAPGGAGRKDSGQRSSCCSLLLDSRVGAWRGSEECPGRRRLLPALLFSVIQKYCFGFS